MASAVRIWEIDEADRLMEIPQVSVEDQGAIEREIENWVLAEPTAVADDLLLIGRQVRTDSGPLDLLGVLSDGRVVVVELKRDRAPREAVAQALDYASFIALQTSDWVREIAQDYLKRSLDEAFREQFDQEMPELELSAPAIRIVGSRLDTATERIITHLQGQYGMDIDGVVLRLVTLSSGGRLLTRISVSPEAGPVSDRTPYSVPEAELLRLAEANGASPLVQRLREVGMFLGEQPTRTFGGSFRYWGFGKMLCGVNVAKNWNAPAGSLDVWVSYGSWAEATGRDPETEILAALDSAGLQRIRHYSGSRRMVFRVNTTEQAMLFVHLIKAWFEGDEAPPLA